MTILCKNEQKRKQEVEFLVPPSNGYLKYIGERVGEWKRMQNVDDKTLD